MMDLPIELIVSVVILVISTVIYTIFFRVPGGAAKVVDDSNSKWAKQNGTAKADESDESDTDNTNAQRMTILWGSQSGTAETFASDLADEAKQHGFKAKAVDVEQYDTSKLKDEKCVIFLQATYGEGDPTDNAMEFFEWLKSDELSENSMTNLKYSVFALGNRQYEKFCGAGVYLDSRLEEIGAKRIMDVGKGDDDGSLADDFDEWKQEFWKNVKSELSSESSAESGAGGENESGEQKFICHYKMSEVKQDYTSGIKNFKPSDTKHKHVLVPVIDNRELRKGNATDKDSSTRHIEFDISDTDMDYTTADNLYIWPANTDKMVQRMRKRFNIKDIEQVIKIETTKGSKPTKLGVPEAISYHDLFSWYLDVNALAPLKVVKLLAQYAENDQKTHKKLHGWHTEEKKQFNEQKYSVMELLELFPQVNVPLIDLIECTPKLKARPYTISSSSVVQPKVISVTLSIAIDTNLPNGRRHEGTCTHYLRQLQPKKDKVWVYITQSTFRLPKAVPEEKIDKCVPVIMIGPGTGLAPFRAFIHEIKHIREEQNLHIGPAVLFYGCRNSKQDFIYEDELTDASEKKVLNNLFLAFSREKQEADKPKRYVQHLMIDNGKMIWEMLHDKKGYLYVCGGTSMGGAIRDAIVEIGEKYGNFTHQRAKEYLAELQDKKRYIAELWS